MPAELLTTASRIQCPHGGQAVLTTANAKVSAGGMKVLLESDVHSIALCPFTVGSNYSPCVRIEWTAGAMLATIDGVAPLIRSSVGKCLNAAGALQGTAVIVNTQTKARAT